MWRVLENDINQNIYITMKKRIFTTLLALVAIALTTNTQAKETYAVLSSNGETLTKLDAIYGNPDYDDFTAVIPIDAIHFPDAKFRNWLLSQEYGQDGELTPTEIAGVGSMDVSNQQIADLTGIEYFTSLKDLNCRDNQLQVLDVSQNTNLTHFDCANNRLTSLNMTGCSPTASFQCFGNQLAGDYMDEFIDNLPEPSVSSLIPTIAIYNEADNEGNKFTQSQINSIVSKGWHLGFFLDNNMTAYITSTGSMPIASFIFPDAYFRNWLLAQSYGADGVLTKEEIEGTYNFNLYNMNIADLTGIEYFTELTYLYCPNNQLTTLDVSMNVKLRDLFCNDNQLTTLNVSNNPDLEHIYCNNNQLTTLDASSCTSLTRLYCYDNPIRGAGMDNLIEKLPQRDWNDGELYVYDVNSTNVSAICTPKHVAAAEQKGWMVYYQNSEYHWELYEGFAAIMGDTNGDGSVNIDDAIAVTNYLLGHPDTNFNLTAADVNGDSQVSIADVTAIINQLLLDVIKDHLQKDLKACRAILAQCRDDLESKDNGHEHSDLWSELERLETAVDNLATAVENATTKNELTNCATDLNSIMSDLAQLEMNIMKAFL